MLIIEHPDPGSASIIKTSATSSTNAYRPELDGLRAVAVAAVILFHYGFWVPGGYVGVDVFFVLSGYLITSIVAREVQNNTFRLAGFWERRIRRIFPALAAMVACTLAFGAVLLLSADYKALAISVIAQSAFLANVLFTRGRGYFDAASDEKPLLHTWSLSVEEQFYFLFPFCALMVLRCNLIKRSSFVIVFLAAVSASFVANILLTENAPTAAFFLLPSRAWELLIGVGVAFAQMRIASGIWREAVGYAGLILILISVLAFSAATAFPGFAALLPCLGAALFIVGTSRDEHGRTTGAARLLSSGLLVSIGRMSYSLYLWHWPPLAFITYWDLEINVPCKLLLLAFTIAASMLSWRYIEKPFRERHICSTPTSLFYFTAATTAVLIGVSLLIIGKSGLPSRLPDRVQVIDRAKADRTPKINQTLADIKSGNLPKLGVGAGGTPEILLWGDSHARVMIPAFDRLCNSLEVSGVAITHSATPPVIGDFGLPGGLGEAASDWSEGVLGFVKENSVPNVFLVAKWEAYGIDASSLPKAFHKTVETLERYGSQVWIILNVPSHDVDVIRGLARREWLGLDTKFQRLVEDHSARMRDVIERFRMNDLKGAYILNPAGALLEPNGQTYQVERNGIPLYYDKHHLTSGAADQIIAPWLIHSVEERQFESYGKQGARGFRLRD